VIEGLHALNAIPKDCTKYLSCQNKNTEKVKKYIIEVLISRDFQELIL
jgi:chemotaxis regulatin CheY-phosphate phosphatase CheZ